MIKKGTASRGKEEVLDTNFCRTRSTGAPVFAKVKYDNEAVSKAKAIGKPVK
jgi:hypothetical protein